MPGLLVLSSYQYNGFIIAAYNWRNEHERSHNFAIAPLFFCWPVSLTLEIQTSVTTSWNWCSILLLVISYLVINSTIICHYFPHLWLVLCRFYRYTCFVLLPFIPFHSGKIKLLPTLFRLHNTVSHSMPGFSLDVIISVMIPIESTGLCAFSLVVSLVLCKLSSFSCISCICISSFQYREEHIIVVAVNSLWSYKSWLIWLWVWAIQRKILKCVDMNVWWNRRKSIHCDKCECWLY